MIPMLRVLARGKSRGGGTLAMRHHFSCADGPRGRTGPGANRRHSLQYGWLSLLPAVVSEGLVGLGHLVHVLAPLDRRADGVGGVENLIGQALGHGLLATLTAVADQPADSQGV